MEKLKVGILGATGMVGQRFVTLLENHPWFELTEVVASRANAGKSYAEALDGNKWKLDVPMPEYVKDLRIKELEDDMDQIVDDVDFIFSAVNMPKDDIKKLEEDYARRECPVVSNNSAHRWTKDVPMVIPEINPEHYALINDQRKRLGTKRGFIAVKPNCSIQSYTPALAAWRRFEPYQVAGSTYQAISGAGKNFESWPEMVGNVIPFISGEEEKSEKEPLRVLGTYRDGQIDLAKDLVITSQCIRIPVLNGHTATVFVNFHKKPTKEELVQALRDYEGEPQKLDLPLAPKHFIQYLEDDDRPQVKLDVDWEKGMGISIGRLREDTLFDYKFVGLSHNTLRGAAGGGVEAAEFLYKTGWITKR